MLVRKNLYILHVRDQRICAVLEEKKHKVKS